jgi:hypothetical protein
MALTARFRSHKISGIPNMKIQAPDRTTAERGTLTDEGAAMMPAIPPVIESSGSNG